jgi:hypothetical protein
LSFPCGRIRSDGDLPSSGADPAGSPKTQIARICATRLVACQVAASPIKPRQSSNMVDAKSTGAVRWVNLVFAWVRRALRGFRRLSRLRVWSCLTRIKPNIAEERFLIVVFRLFVNYCSRRIHIATIPVHDRVPRIYCARRSDLYLTNPLARCQLYRFSSITSCRNSRYNAATRDQEYNPARATLS